MARFVLEEVVQGLNVQIGFADFQSIVTGLAITSALDAGPALVEFGLSGDMNLKIMHAPDGLELSLVSTLNPDDVPSMVVQLPGPEGGAPAFDLALRLVGLSELYAYATLIGEPGRSEELIDAILEQRRFSSLLREEEQLIIESVGPGSLLLTLKTFAVKQYQRLGAVLMYVYAPTREHVLRRAEATTRALEADAQSKALDNARKAFDLNRAMLDYEAETAQKLPEIETELRRRLAAETARVTASDPQSQQVMDAVDKMLPQRLIG